MSEVIHIHIHGARRLRFFFTSTPQTLSKVRIFDRVIKRLGSGPTREPHTRSRFGTMATSTLSYTMWMDDGAEHICRAITSGSLREVVELDLQHHRIGDNEMEAIAKVLQDCAPGMLGNVKVLNLRGNRIGDDGLAAFANALRARPTILPKLKQLNLRNNRIGAEGAEMLAQVLHENPEALALVEILDLDLNPGSDFSRPGHIVGGKGRSVAQVLERRRGGSRN